MRLVAVAGAPTAFEMGEEGTDDDIEKHVKRRFEICQRLGKGARAREP